MSEYRAKAWIDTIRGTLEIENPAVFAVFLGRKEEHAERC
jgi:hypothetical protein